MTAPTSKAGVSRFLADYQSSTRYRVWVKVKGSWEPCSWLPTFATMTEAELAALKVAGPTRVDAELAERNGDGVEPKPTASPAGRKSVSYAGDSNAVPAKCVAEIEQDIDFQDCAPEGMRGSVNYGSVVDPFGGSPE